MNARLILCTLALSLGTQAVASGQPAAPPSPDPAIAAIPAKMISAFLATNPAALRANCAAGTTVIDEFAPYVWSGADACVRWAREFKAFAARIKLTNVKGTVKPNPIIDVSGRTAYLTAQIHFDGMINGKPSPEEGTWTFVLSKTGTGWKITNLAWGTLHR